MTNEKWEIVKEYASRGEETDACLLELRMKIEVLEKKYETMRRAVLEWGKDVDAVKRWSDDHLKRIMALESVQKPTRSASLLERVVMAIGRDKETARWEEAHAAIREVAAWLREQHDGDPVAATLLEKEANK